MVEVNYKYSKGALSQIIRDAGQNSTADSMTYSFTYDSFGNTTSVKVGTYTLATYQYESYNGKLIKTTYGNGDYVQNVYDEFDRLVGIKVNGVSKYTYSYNGNGDIVRIEDVDSGITEWYNYDSLDRLVSSFRKHSSGESMCTYYSYSEVISGLGRSLTRTMFELCGIVFMFIREVHPL